MLLKDKVAPLKSNMGAVLRCLECRPVHGDTMWANMELACERTAAGPCEGNHR